MNLRDSSDFINLYKLLGLHKKPGQTISQQEIKFAFEKIDSGHNNYLVELLNQIKENAQQKEKEREYRKELGLEEKQIEGYLSYYEDKTNQINRQIEDLARQHNYVRIASGALSDPQIQQKYDEKFDNFMAGLSHSRHVESVTRMWNFFSRRGASPTFINKQWKLPPEFLYVRINEEVSAHLLGIYSMRGRIADTMSAARQLVRSSDKLINLANAITAAFSENIFSVTDDFLFGGGIRLQKDDAFAASDVRGQSTHGLVVKVRCNNLGASYNEYQGYRANPISIEDIIEFYVRLDMEYTVENPFSKEKFVEAEPIYNAPRHRFG